MRIESRLATCGLGSSSHARKGFCSLEIVVGAIQRASRYWAPAIESVTLRLDSPGGRESDGWRGVTNAAAVRIPRERAIILGSLLEPYSHDGASPLATQELGLRERWHTGSRERNLQAQSGGLTARRVGPLRDIEGHCCVACMGLIMHSPRRVPENGAVRFY